MGSAITAITFPYFLTDKDIIPWITFVWESKTMCKMMRNIEKQGVWIAKKKVKIYIRHSQKNLRHYIC